VLDEASGLRGRASCLDLDEQRGIAELTEYFLERWHDEPRAAIRKRAPVGGESRTRVGFADAREWQGGYSARRIGGAIERRVVDDDGDSISRQVHVELDALGARGERLAKRLECVLGRVGRVAAVPHNGLAGRIEERVKQMS